MLNFYLASVVICFLVLLVSNEAIVSRMKREEVYYKENRSLFEVIQSLFIVLIPFVNVVLALVIIFSYEEVYQLCVKRIQERKRIIERVKKDV